MVVSGCILEVRKCGRVKRTQIEERLYERSGKRKVTKRE
jgi:hypothetical protein